MKNLAHCLAVPISDHVVTFISLVAAAALPSRTTGQYCLSYKYILPQRYLTPYGFVFFLSRVITYIRVRDKGLSPWSEWPLRLASVAADGQRWENKKTQTFYKNFRPLISFMASGWRWLIGPRNSRLITRGIFPWLDRSRATSYLQPLSDWFQFNPGTMILPSI